MQRHSHRALRPPTLRLTLFGATLLAAGAHAAGPAAPFVMVAYSNRTGGATLVSGDYGSAAQAVQQGGMSGSDPQALATNRCVAYAMSGQLAPARAACDAAVRESQPDDSMLTQASAHGRAQAADASALAYSNRAVLHWLNAEGRAAQEDLARARLLAPQADFVARNLAALRAHAAAPAPITAATLKAANE